MCAIRNGKLYLLGAAGQVTGCSWAGSSAVQWSSPLLSQMAFGKSILHRLALPLAVTP